MTSSDVIEPTEDEQKKDSTPTEISEISVPTDPNVKLHTPVPVSPAAAERCSHLMSETIAYFTPILFTPATTSHMACTDVFADTWMSLVIQPALDSDGVYKPLEMLQKIIEIDWASYGLCVSCCVEKRNEWRNEQEDIWTRMDKWL